MDGIIDVIKNYEGIIGALLGVIVTTILNEYIKSKGRVNFYFLNYKNRFMSTDDYGFYGETNDIENSKGFEYEFEMQLYNSSDINKIIREIEIEFICKNGVITTKAYDESTRRVESSRMIKDELKVINIRPKEIIVLTISGHLNKGDENILMLKDIKRINLKAKDYRDKPIKKLIKDFSRTS